MLQLNGRQGKSVIVDGASIKIVKAGSVFSSPREKILPIKNITSVEVKKPGPFIVGFIQFSIAGGIARDSSFNVSGGAFNAVQDENSVVFADQESYAIALKIKDYIQNFTESGGSPIVKGIDSIADEIRKLKLLVDDGILTQEEFTKKKQQLLGLGLEKCPSCGTVYEQSAKFCMSCYRPRQA
jgi:hypothetical protein